MTSFCVFVAQSSVLIEVPETKGYYSTILPYYQDSSFPKNHYFSVQTVTVFHPWVCWNITARGPLPWTTMNRHVACWMSQHALRAQKEVARLDFVVKPRGQLLSRHVNDSLESKVLTKNRTSGIPGLDCPTHCISASPPGSAFLLVSAVTRFLVAHQLILVQI